MIWIGFGARREHPKTKLYDIRPGVGDAVGDIRQLPMLSRTVDGIECHHVIEHLTPEDGQVALKECWRVLRPGGILELSCPDLEACARTLLAGNLEILMNIYSPHAEEAQRHRWGYTWASLLAAVIAAGFTEVVPLPLTEPHEIRLRARKPPVAH